MAKAKRRYVKKNKSGSTSLPDESSGSTTTLEQEPIDEGYGERTPFIGSQSEGQEAPAHEDSTHGEDTQYFEPVVPLATQLRESGISELHILKLRSVVYYTSKVGLGLEDSCKLADIPLEEFQELVEANPIVKGILERKELEYKKDLIATLSAKARQGDDKLAQWLLERRFPEFSTKGSRVPDGEDLLGMAISFIQKSGSSTPLINETSGKAFVIQKSGGQTISWQDKFKKLLA